MSLPITSLYSSLTALLIVGLGARVIKNRVTRKIPIGDGGDNDMLQIIRVHGNLIEYAPITLILLGLTESYHYAPYILHILGTLFIASRLYHAWGLSTAKGRSRGRQLGAIGNGVVIVVLAVILLWQVMFTLN